MTTPPTRAAVVARAFDRIVASARSHIESFRMPSASNWSRQKALDELERNVVVLRDALALLEGEASAPPLPTEPPAPGGKARVPASAIIEEIESVTLPAPFNAEGTKAESVRAFVVRADAVTIIPDDDAAGGTR